MNNSEFGIIDLREFTGNKSGILSCSDDEVIFEKEIKDGGKTYYSLNSYDMKSNEVKEVHRYQIPDYEYTSQFIRILEKNIIVIKMNFINNIEVDVLDRFSKELKSTHSFEIDEEISSIPVSINDRYFIFYGDFDDLKSKKYEEYRENGYHHCLYLCDLKEDRVYFIDDLRLVKGLTVVHAGNEGLPVFVHEGMEHLIFNETYMDDYEYEEDIYEGVKSGRIKREWVNSIEALYMIELDRFVEEVKSRNKNINFDLIGKRYLDGWIRYITMDEKQIFYREKDFETQIERIVAVDKKTLKKTNVAEIDHDDISGRLLYGEIIYEIKEPSREQRDVSFFNLRVAVKGIYNCNWDFEFDYKKNIWLEGFIANRFLVTSQWVEEEIDEDNCNYHEYVFVRDVQEDKETRYDGVCEIFNNYVILHRTAGYYE